MRQNSTIRNLRIVGVVFVIFMISTIGIEIFNTIKTNVNISKVTKENKKLKNESQKLVNEVKKLKDENYIQSYVNGTIFSTEKGVSVYILPKDDTPE